MNKISYAFILVSMICFQQELNASSSGADIFGNCVVLQNDKVECEGIKLYISENASLTCGKANTELTENPATFSITRVTSENDINTIIPHIISGNLTVCKDGIFISKCDTLDSNTTIFTHTSNIKTDCLSDFDVNDNNIPPNNCIILNGESYHKQQEPNSTIVFEPKSKINGTDSNNKGQIYGGIIDFTSYVRIAKIENNPQIKLDTYNGTQVTKEHGNLINAHVKNAFIKLFIQEDMNNIKDELTLDPDIDPINNTTNTNKILFNKVKFTQCISEVPGSGSYSGYGEQKQLIKNRQNEPDYLKYNKINNVEVVKRLFNGNLNPIITGNSLNTYNLKFNTIWDLKSFSDLFRQYINYNCYIKTSDDENYKLSEAISDKVIKNGIKYPVSSEHPLEQVSVLLYDNIEIPNTNPQEYFDRHTSTYIQVRGDNVHNVNLTSNKNGRTVHFYNEWINFNGIVSCNNIKNIVQEYYPMNIKYKGHSVQLQSNGNLNYIFKKNGIIDLNYLPVDNNNKVILNLQSINICAGQDRRNRNKVRVNKHNNTNNTVILVDRIAIEDNTVFRFLPGTSIIIGNPNA